MKKSFLMFFLLFSLVFFSFGVVSFAEDAVTQSSVTTQAAVTEQAATVSLTPAAIAEVQQNTEIPVIKNIDSGDTAWVLLGAILVLMMTIPALAIFYGGMVRKKNLLSTLAYSLGATIVASIMWVFFLYSTTFGGKELIGGVIGGFDKMFLDNVQLNGAYGSFTVPEFAFIAFQFTFAAITIALISGAIVERMKFSAWMIFSAIWLVLVYSPVAHMVWHPEGLLNKMGVLDFAGGYVVEIASGISAMVAALFIGERVRYKKETILPNNIPLVFIGAALLWVGWFGFNAGSAMKADGVAGNAFMVTNTAGAMGALVWLIIERVVSGKATVIGGVSGVVAGMVAITPAAGFVDNKAALIIGAVAGGLCYLFVAKVKKRFGYDDSLDVFGIHGMGGTWGIIATGLFANPNIHTADVAIGKAGLFYGNAMQLWIQVKGIVVVYAVVIVGTLITLLIVRAIMKLRVEPQEEIYGLDLTLHGERATE